MKYAVLIFLFCVNTFSVFAQLGEDIPRPSGMKYFEIGVKKVGPMLQEWSQMNKGYQIGQVPFKNWKNRRAPFDFNYHAELIKDTAAKLNSDSMRWSVARFVPGYRIFAMDCFGMADIVNWKNIELIFHNGVLINFTADAEPMVLKLMTQQNGQPRIAAKRDTIVKFVPTAGKKLSFVMDTVSYVWRDGNNKAELKVSDYLDKKYLKKKSAVLFISDSVSTAAYEQQVRLQMAELKRRQLARS